MTKLDNLEKLFERQNGILQQMLDIMPRPVSKFTRALEMAVLVVGTASVVGIADTIMKWIKGGTLAPLGPG